MAKSSSLPPHGVRITTYAELDQYVRAFGEGHLNLLMVFGPPGVGKSRCVGQALGSRVCWIGGQATPFGIYLQAYAHRHEPIILDDVDGLYADRAGITSKSPWWKHRPFLELADSSVARSYPPMADPPGRT